ncbi:hypothetical protein GJA_3027 [Janthinobacterium agaricidamnosum NBRC 102515 = DSM 9628]|uniref:Uncharacterized protein n=2 Tax=Janthinobacterium agaricidamnosum TaxID=55508 RepID=W0V8H9_9BURK|nr:hypothetical protein GJA_3027 [Janthinobacterium agaricidamnosum NBRC 102515 = DSM 9628]
MRNDSQRGASLRKALHASHSRHSPAHPASAGPLRGVNLAQERTPVSAELHNALDAFLTYAKPRFGRRRDDELVQAEKLLQPLANKQALSHKDLLTLLEASSVLEALARRKPEKAEKSKELRQRIDNFIGPAEDLARGLRHLGAQIEHRAAAKDITTYIKENYPGMVTTDPHTGKPRLTPKGAGQYNRIKQEFENTALNRTLIRAIASNMDDGDRAVQKIVDNTYRDYQNALRAPGQAPAAKYKLIECAGIIAGLTRASPEKVVKERYATVFPGGATHPSELVHGETSRENGFLFVGGERPSDHGYKMKVTLDKGYGVDARQYYGHSDAGDEKMQWLTLPGAQFRFDGIENASGKPTYLFSQVSR